MISGKHLYFLLVILLLWGCDPGGLSGLPAGRPMGAITGRVVDAPIANAQVSIYSFENGQRGIKLGGTVTDNTGAYSLNLRIQNQPILIEISGGSYLDEASGTLVTLEQGQVLRAISQYQTGQPVELMVTPLTHMATALAEYKIGAGVPVEQAIAEATATVNEFFALDTSTTKPTDITEDNNHNSELGGDLLYSFYLAGLSDWSLWASQQNQAEQPNITYTTIALSQIIFHDLRSDGLLNGIGATEFERLGIGQVPLDADAYRLAFSLHMLAIANSSKNKTGFTGNDLLDTANRIAAQTTLLVGATDPVDIVNQQPTLSIDLPTGPSHCGLFSFQVNVESVLGAERITMSVSNGGQVKTEEEFLLEDPRSLQIEVDTRNYIDGEYQFDLTAVDMLDNRAAVAFTVQFDNSTPVIKVTSPPATSQPITQITGTLNCITPDNQAIYVNGEPATLLGDGSWSASIEIGPGENIIPISVFDKVGVPIFATETKLYLDDIPPVIDSTDKHSQVRFSNGDGNFTQGELQDINNATVLYFETDNVDLGGVLINRQTLDNNTIPYFAFSVSDLMAPGAATDPQYIQVRMQYQRNDQVLNPWHKLSLVGSEYLVPLASETLSSNWHQSTSLDEHLIQIEVTDGAGNQTTRTFSFRGDFYVPAFSIANENIADLGTDIFSTTDFANRENLNNMEFTSTAYTFTNPTGKAFYINLSDNSIHTTNQSVDQLVREHLINTVITTEWRIGLMNPDNTAQCPDFNINSNSWVYPTSVFNWNGTTWVKEYVPEPAYGAPEPVYSDSLPPFPSPSGWNDVPDFDREFMKVDVIDVTLTRLTYQYDYILNKSNNVSAGYVFGWKYSRPFGPDIICPSKRYFHQRKIFSYESVDGYPKTVLSTVEIADTPDFITSSVIIMDNNTGLEISPVNGWFHIPADHSITIHKKVTSPTLSFYNDDISDVINYTSYTPSWQDKSITWSVDRNLSISISHDAGENNIPYMPVRSISAGEGIMAYQIAR